jgi:hypothetical protein
MENPTNVMDIIHNESNFETSKNESFADDSTTLTYLEYSDLAAFKKNLENFRNLSGLKCNLEKTVIVRIGDRESEPDPRIANLGFTVEDECKLLGFTVSGGEETYVKNFHNLKDKVKKTINVWKIFNFSLSGKLTILKTLVYPILNYYLSILTPDPVWLNDIDCIIESYVVNGMNISKEKIYRNPAEGGLGLFRSEIFFKALKVSWIRRCLQLTHDNWRQKIITIPDPGFFLFRRRTLQVLARYYPVF